ncbi:MAG: hypothetical protein U0133_01430 [Gemmatimonadales bacterium]
MELDARLEERPGRGRCMSRETARTGRALLAAGDREVVRDAGPEPDPRGRARPRAPGAGGSVAPLDPATSTR